jgi:hypothetical protein
MIYIAPTHTFLKAYNPLLFSLNHFRLFTIYGFAFNLPLVLPFQQLLSAFSSRSKSKPFYHFVCCFHSCLNSTFFFFFFWMVLGC